MTVKVNKLSERMRCTISVPIVDTSVIDWVEMQANLSMSLRMLIRSEIEKNGYTDIVTRPVEVK